MFSDEEILTIYFFVAHEQKYTLIKDIHNFAKKYLREWFPKLVSYQTFNYRLNRMAGAVTELSSLLLSMFKPSDCQEDTVIVDSMQIITCCGRNRTGKVARDIADKIYRSSDYREQERRDKAMNSMLLSSQSNGLLRRKSREARPL